MVAPYDSRKQEYNKFTNLPSIPYNCITYLMDNNETIWKLLKYKEADAWNKTNLTKAQKGALIYDGSADETKFRVFLDIGQENPWTDQACILRISIIEAVPTNYIWGNISIGMECYTHYKINHLSNYETRLDVVMQQLVETFNGAEIGGLGRLYFDSYASGRCKMVTIGNPPFKGKAVTLCNYLTS
jgi:hypothetical protein